MTLFLSGIDDWIVPQFSGTSFMKLSDVGDAHNAITVEMTFRSYDVEGLLLYSGQVGNGDFISLAVNHAKVEFR